jgi:hypothetical protein
MTLRLTKADRRIPYRLTAKVVHLIALNERKRLLTPYRIK